MIVLLMEAGFKKLQLDINKQLIIVLPAGTQFQNNTFTGEILFFQTQDGNTRIDVRLADETVWLTQVQMAELVQTTKQNVSLINEP